MSIDELVHDAIRVLDQQSTWRLFELTVEPFREQTIEALLRTLDERGYIEVQLWHIDDPNPKPLENPKNLQPMRSRYIRWYSPHRTRICTNHLDPEGDEWGVILRKYQGDIAPEIRLTRTGKAYAARLRLGSDGRAPGTGTEIEALAKSETTGDGAGAKDRTMLQINRQVIPLISSLSPLDAVTLAVLQAIARFGTHGQGVPKERVAGDPNLARSLIGSRAVGPVPELLVVAEVASAGLGGSVVPSAVVVLQQRGIIEVSYQSAVLIGAHIEKDRPVGWAFRSATGELLSIRVLGRWVFACRETGIRIPPEYRNLTGSGFIHPGCRVVAGWKLEAKHAFYHLLPKAFDVLERAATPSPARRPPVLWKPPPGYVGTKDICHDPRFTKCGKNPVPSSIQRWVERDKRESKADNRDPVKIEPAPDTHENYYPETWVMAQIVRWKPRRPA